MLLLCGLVAASPALAVGFGPIPQSIPYGQPLDLSVPLRLDGDAPPPGCLQAQVRIGDQRLPPDRLQLQLEGRDDPRVRIRSTEAVREPVVALQLTVGCSGPVSRQFVVFADPARQGAAAATPPAAVTTPAPPSTRRPAGPAPSAGPRTPARSTTAAMPPTREAHEALPPPAVPADSAALDSAMQAASAARAAASAAEQRRVAVKADLALLRDEAAAQRASIAQMRARLAQAEDPGRAQVALAAFLVPLGLVALWLGWRVRGLQRERQAAWWPGMAETGLPDAPASEPAAPPEAAAAGPASWVADDLPVRAAGVEELIDLQQEVEFFELLGDEDAAVDLLSAYLRGRGDASPLPYLQLLQIHRRRQDREAYERVARHFGQCFGAIAPGWDAGAEPGRGLQDCSVALAELQAQWAAPAHAMAWLERRLLSGPGEEMPGLPAYGDLLMLYAVARDLHRQAGEADTAVDLLLPIGGSEDIAAALRPSIFDTLQPGGAGQVPEAAIDLDLSRPAELPRPG